MRQSDAEQTGERAGDQRPWWTEPATWGAVVLITLGFLLAAWIYFGLPGAPEEANGYFGTGKVVAFGLVLLGTTVLGRRDTASGDDTDPDGPEGRA